jgi:hypothetical protein
MVMEQEVNRPNVGHLKLINQLTLVLLKSQELADLGHHQETAQPVLFVVMMDKEAGIAVTTFIA